MTTNKDLRDLTYQEVDAIEGGYGLDCSMNAWDKWIYNNFIAPNEAAESWQSNR
jgi:hypothetical protein